MEDPTCEICGEPRSAHVPTERGPLTHPREARGEGIYEQVYAGYTMGLGPGEDDIDVSPAWRFKPREESQPWKTRMAQALADGDCSSQAEWVKLYPGKHCWFRFRDDDFNSCACCGIVQQRDDQNKPCKGVVTIELRS
jgi:hypothetical protein